MEEKKTDIVPVKFKHRKGAEKAYMKMSDGKWYSYDFIRKVHKPAFKRHPVWNPGPVTIQLPPMLLTPVPTVRERLKDVSVRLFAWMKRGVMWMWTNAAKIAAVVGSVVAVLAWLKC